MQDKLTDEQMAGLVLGLHEESNQPWDLDKATALAQAEQLELTDAHLDVIQYLRMTFDKHGPIKHARTLTQALEAKFAAKGGRKYLYQLFPGGPVTQGCKLAGIPLPADSTDKSFGSRV